MERDIDRERDGCGDDGSADGCGAPRRARGTWVEREMGAVAAIVRMDVVLHVGLGAPRW